MAIRYVIRTVDEDWIDLVDEPVRIEDRRAAWAEVRRRVAADPDLKTVVFNRDTGALLWQSDPAVPPRYEVLAVDETVFHVLDTDLSVTGDLLSAHKEKDDAWTAFYEAVKTPVGNDIIVLCDTMQGDTVLATSDEDRYSTDAA